MHELRGPSPFIVPWHTMYQELFGWQPSESMDMGPMGTYQMFNRPHGMIGGMMNRPPEMANVPPHW
jgi:hypothetical protein